MGWYLSQRIRLSLFSFIQARAVALPLSDCICLSLNIPSDISQPKCHFDVSFAAKLYLHPVGIFQEFFIWWYVAERTQEKSQIIDFIGSTGCTNKFCLILLGFYCIIKAQMVIFTMRSSIIWISRTFSVLCNCVKKGGKFKSLKTSLWFSWFSFFLRYFVLYFVRYLNFHAKITMRQPFKNWGKF